MKSPSLPYSVKSGQLGIVAHHCFKSEVVSPVTMAAAYPLLVGLHSSSGWEDTRAHGYATKPSVSMTVWSLYPTVEDAPSNFLQSAGSQAEQAPEGCVPAAFHHTAARRRGNSAVPGWRLCSSHTRIWHCITEQVGADVAKEHKVLCSASRHQSLWVTVECAKWIGFHSGRAPTLAPMQSM